jgi:phage repressor protein C with HTH and peptisase S24 domain
MVAADAVLPALRWVEFLPFYEVAAAAGDFDFVRKLEDVECESWIHLPDERLSREMFAVRIEGKSMEPKIADGSVAIFRGGSALGGTRQGRIVLVRSNSLIDPETGWNMVVKKYESKKIYEGELFSHEKIILHSLNSEYAPVVIEDGNDDDYKVLGEFVKVI